MNKSCFDYSEKNNNNNITLELGKFRGKKYQASLTHTMRLRQKACSTHYPPLKGEWLKELQECKSSPTGLMIATGSKGWNAETLTHLLCLRTPHT